MSTDFQPNSHEIYLPIKGDRPIVFPLTAQALPLLVFPSTYAETTVGKSPTLEFAKDRKGLEILSVSGLTLCMGTLDAYPITFQASVLDFPLKRYENIGYINPKMRGELETMSDYNPLDTHIVVMDTEGEILYNINFVHSDQTSFFAARVPFRKRFPTEQLFDFPIPKQFANVKRNMVQEPSRLTVANPQEYIRKFGASGSRRLQIAKFLLAIGLSEHTIRSGMTCWLLNYVPEMAGGFVKGISGGDLSFPPIEGATPLSAVYEGPFGPYFKKHFVNGKNEVLVTLVDAQMFASRIKAFSMMKLTELLNQQ